MLIYEGKSVYDSPICIEFLEDFFPEKTPHLLPQDPFMKAKARLLGDHITKKIIPNFYAILGKETEEERKSAKEALTESVAQLMRDASEEGPFMLGAQPTLPDIMLAPWGYRSEVVLSHFRDFVFPSSDASPEFKRYHEWMKAVNEWDCFKKTLADEQKLIGTYERYANNTAKSLVADAIRKGTALP